MSGDKKITLDQHVDLAEQVDKRLDALEAGTPKVMALTLASGGWTEDSGDENYPFQYKLTVAGVTDASRADAVLDAGSVALASDCGVCAVSETATNTVIFKSRTAPTADLTGSLYITKTVRTDGTQS